MKNILVLEDDKSFRELIVSEINKLDGFQCIGSYETIKSLLQALPELDPDLFWFDISLPDGNSIALVSEVKELYPNSLCILCTMHDDNETIFEALKSGADGYLLKNASLDKILESLDELVAGGSPMSPYIARKVLHSFRPNLEKNGSILKELTSRENDILMNLAQGYLFKEVASICAISLETVKKHVQNIYKKLHVQNRTEAIIHYLKKKSE